MDVTDRTAVGLEALLRKSFAQQLGADTLENHLVGMMVDGAAVNMGCRQGLGVRLKTNLPWVVVIHCLNHRLELAIKDAVKSTYIDDISNMLMNLYYLYEKSPKRLRELRELAEILQENVLKPHRAHGTRWVEHKFKSVHGLLQAYSVIVSHLTNMVEDKSAVTSDKPRIRGYLRILTSVQFVMYLLYFYELLMALKRLSQCLQGDSTDLNRALAALKATKTVLESHVERTTLQVEIQTLFDLQENGQEIKFKGISLQSFPTGSSHFLRNRSPIAASILKCLSERFSEFESETVFTTIKILDVALWPKVDEKKLNEFGVTEISNALEHFKLLLNFDTNAITATQREWSEVKIFVAFNLLHLESNEIWSTLTANYMPQYGHLLKVINILRVLPVSNAIVERCFSTMCQVKTDWRNRLDNSTLEALLRIKQEGPSCAEYNAMDAAKYFFNRKKRHPSVVPYGPHTTQTKA